MSKRTRSEELEEPSSPQQAGSSKRVALENRDTSPLSVASGFDADEQDRINQDFLTNGSAGDISPLPEKQGPRQNQNREPKFRDGDNETRLRIILSPKEAGEIIGRKGATITKIKNSTGVRMKLSENYPGAQKRIVLLRGSPENVAKTAGLIVRVLKNDPYDQPSTADSEPFNMALVFPHASMGCLIGKGGSKFREIEESSSAKLKAQEAKLPLSDDRILNVFGVADAIHIAVYYICMTYNSQKDTFFKPGYSYREYDPELASHRRPRAGTNGSDLGARVGDSQRALSTFGEVGYSHDGHGEGVGKLTILGNHKIHEHAIRITPPLINGDSSLPRAQEEAQRAPQNATLCQNVIVPNRFAGSIIGKKGSKINEIRRISKSHVKVADADGSDDRRITITGLPDGNQLAIYLIHQKIEEDERLEQENLGK